MLTPIQVFEHQKLTGLDPALLEKLYQFNDDHGNKYFTGIRGGVKFTEYVGVIQIGKQTIEILPKADKNKESDVKMWRDALLDMLAVCRKINVESVSDAQLKRRYFSLLDLYFDRFLNELEFLLHKGLIKKYRKQTGNVSALKGRLLFAQQIQKNLVHQERFYTQHQTYDTEHLINQILLKALKVLSKIVSNPFLTGRIQKLLLNFPEIKEVPIKKSHFDQVKLNLKSADYAEALQISKMIILNYSPDLSGGNENMIALLFNMNNLWEEYVYRMLKRASNKDYQIEPQKSQKFWNTTTIRPDIVVKKISTKETFIIDTKWKVIDNLRPSDDDLKQIYAYNQYWNSAYSLLLYPHVEAGDGSSWGKYHIGRVGETGISHCKLSFINVIENKKLDKDIGDKILGVFESIMKVDKEPVVL